MKLCAVSINVFMDRMDITLMIGSGVIGSLALDMTSVNIGDGVDIRVAWIFVGHFSRVFSSAVSSQILMH